MEKKYRWRDGLLVVSILLFFAILYLSQLTTSGLWYDEAIEYYYSRYLTGPVPVNPVDQSGGNMYERICITYQPPLYNILMYLWLFFFDSESGFRLAGVFTTLIGALGFYMSLQRIAGYKWGIFCLTLYLSTAVVAYYALECGEYNLLLCMECWMLYFFVRCCQSNKEVVQWRDLLCFYLFATLSIYSQYGSAFFIVGLFIALCYNYIKSRLMPSLYRLFVTGAITFIIAIVPLYIFFVCIQMENQGSSNITHTPVFVGSVMGGVPYSLYKSFYELIKWVFSSSLECSWLSMKIMQVLMLFFFAFTFVSMFLKTKTSVLKPTIIASIVCYTIFFLLSACSFYAYNWWDGHLGCYNIIYYKRYAVFFVPLLLFALSIGISSFLKNMNNLGYYKTVIVSITFIIVTCIINILYSLSNWKIKTDTREATIEWLDKKDFRNKIIVQGASSPVFMYYVQHSVYYKEVKNNIILTKQEIDTQEEIERHIRELGVFDLSGFYFIGHSSAWNMKGKGIQYIINLFKKEGYEVLFLRPQDKETSLLFFRKCDIK